ncbi:P-loop containing nucleoside triphosphate hydrolase protein [Gaertneriomyces semiglobifer]|nr:P-loop containing nucleoside triphosphate hydrolase protein [Gaertneriomyces semiglobifer]
MADDDGLMLNFAVEPVAAPANRKTNIKEIADRLKRGNWRIKRLTAKKIAQRIKKPDGSAPSGSSHNASGSNSIAVNKREQREKESSDNENITTGTGEKRKLDFDGHAPRLPNKRSRMDKGGAVNRARAATAGDRSGKQVVSSIFTANPELPVLEDSADNVAPSAPEPEAAPAPIFDSTTFTGLGLNTMLCGHLTAKLKFTAPTAIQRASLPTLLKPDARDHVLQAQTGSGKTLAFLLPIIHKILHAEQERPTLDRSVGTLAIILTPTRELAKQIETVLGDLLRYTGHSAVADEEDEDAAKPPQESPSQAPLGESQKARHWMVAGHIMGGEKKKSEKARLRKGVTIVVATPGRLLDHLKTTKAFECGNLRWLVLDEADRLLELGFEETLKEILQLLQQKRENAVRTRKRMFVRAWPADRQTILCSATIQGGVQRLAEETLQDPEFVRAESTTSGNDTKGDIDGIQYDAGDGEKLVVPRQLKQQHTIVPAKLRLVTLVGMLKSLTKAGRHSKVMVFVSCTDSVDFLYHVLSNGHKEPAEEVSDLEEDDDDEENDPSEKRRRKVDKELNPDLAPPDAGLIQTGSETPLFPSAVLFKLHGSLPQSARTAAYNAFLNTKNRPSVLFCTDVAARGLDMPDVTAIVQYDPPTDVKDYVHRIGRTARLGREGQAILFLLPSEAEYLAILQKQGFSVQNSNIDQYLTELIPASRKQVKAIKGRKPYEQPATDLHMTLERFVLSNKSTLALAESAYSSHVRSYATHVASERHIFHIKKLHLGHIAKSFALREAPKDLIVDKGRRDKESKEKKEMEKRMAKPGSSMYRRMGADLVGSTSEFADGGVKALATMRPVKKQKTGRK